MPSLPVNKPEISDGSEISDGPLPAQASPPSADLGHVAEVGRAIQGARSFAGKLPSAVVHETKIPALDYTAIERGERTPNGGELRRILTAVGLSPEEFLPSLSSEARALVESLLAPKPSEEEETPVAPEGARREDAQPKRAPAARRGLGAARAGRAAASGEIPVTLSNVRACLAAFIKLVPRSRGELVYVWQYREGESGTPLGLVVKIYTSVDAETREAYPTGRDAMRVLIYDERSGRKVEAWSSRINRVGDWPRRLRRLAGEAVMRATYRPSCPRCRLECVVSGPRGAQFWGCPNYVGRKNGCAYKRSLLPRGEAEAGRKIVIGEQEEGAIVGSPEMIRPGRAERGRGDAPAAR